MSGRWRCFVAVPIGDVLRRALEQSVGEWRTRADLDGLRWTESAGWHVTLAFIGATEPSAVEGLRAALARVAAEHEPLRLTAGGLGGFPSRARARVAWYGIADPEGRLAALARAVAPAVGIEPEARFRGHVTLARARAEPVDLRAWVAERSAPTSTLDVDHVDLMRSHLGRGPARYETLASIPLGTSTHA